MRLPPQASSFGLQREGALRSFVIGALGGAAFVSAVIGIYAAAGWYSIASVRVQWAELARWTLLFAVVALIEELVARGLIFGIVARWNVALAVVASAAVFGVLHLGNANATALSAIGIAVHSGLAFAGLLLVTRSLWAPIGAHFTWNLFEGPVWGAPVSGVDADAIVDADITGPHLWTGGAFGPEAGLVMMVLGGGIGVTLLFVAWRTGRFNWPGTRSRAPDASG